MLKTKKRMLIPLVGGLVLVTLVAGVWMLGKPAAVSAAESLQTVTQSVQPGLLGEGYLNHGGGWDFPGLKGGDIDYQQLLADALGITVDDLQTAYQTARDAAIDQAVEQGLLTQEQADTMKVWGGKSRRGFDFLGRAPKGVAESDIDENTLLAEALGITTDDLQAARDAANQAAIEQALAEGLITQEQIDAMQARKTLMTYLDRDTLLAQALDMSVEELQAAYADGETLSTLMNAKGLDAAAVREKLQAATAAALAQAVKDGVITQERADAIQEEMQSGHGMGVMPGGRRPGGRRPGGRGDFRGHGDFDGERPSRDSDTDNSDTSGTGFRSPNQVTLQGGNDL